MEDDSANTIYVSGKPYNVQLVGKKRTNTVDLALFFLPKCYMKPCYKLATQSPVSGEEAWIVGYPHGERGLFRETGGKIERTGIRGFNYVFSRRAYDGASGGPLFVKPFKVAGIVSQTGRSDTIVTEIPEIIAFLTDTIGGVPKCIITKPTEPDKPKPPPREDPPEPVKPDTSEIENALRKLVLQGVGLRLQIAALNRRIDELSKQKGSKGDTGSQGQRGSVGQTGPKGVIGPAGSKGASGVDGKQGTDGVNGAFVVLPGIVLPGLITVELIENGVETQKKENVRTGSTVRFYINRLVKE